MLNRYRESLTTEHGFRDLPVVGHLPVELQGTLYRNGPGLAGLFERPYRSMLEGDGVVSAFRFGNGKAAAAVRIVQSEGLLAERRAGRPLYQSNASWPRRFIRGLKRDIKNTANTSLMLNTEVIVVPIDAPDDVMRFPCDPFFQFHFANGFEREDEVVVDIVRFNDSGPLQALDHTQQRPSVPGRLTRLSICPRRQRLKTETLTTFDCQFPRVDPRRQGQPYNHVWLLNTTEECPRITSLNIAANRVSEFRFPDGHQASEAIIVPRSPGTAEDDGWLLTLVYDPAEHTSRLAVLNAAHLDDGPIAAVCLDHHVPPTFHGCWRSAT